MRMLFVLKGELKMCEIQIIQKLGKEKINKADLGEFFKMMCFGSMFNNDAFGVFNHNTTFKNCGAFDASELNEYDLINSNFIIGHNRLSTNYARVKNPNGGNRKSNNIMPSLDISKGTRVRRNTSEWDWSVNWRDNISNIFLPTCGWGVIDLVEEEVIEEEEQEPVIKEKKSKDIIHYIGDDENRNNHPFVLGDFTLIHNGTITNAQSIHNKFRFKTTISTDSYVILELIDYFFNKSNIKDRVKRISSAIQNTCKELVGGYSVVLYDKKDKNTFYFKNMFTSFSLSKYGDNILCGSTSSENLDYLYFGLDREDIHIKNKRVYKITSDINNPVVDVTLNKMVSIKSLKNDSLYDILVEPVYELKVRRLNVFFKKKFGFIPLYQFSFWGDLKIGSNNSNGIKDKIKTICKKPKRRFGWYIVTASDVLNTTDTKKKKRVKKVKLENLKGGNK